MSSKMKVVVLTVSCVCVMLLLSTEVLSHVRRANLMCDPSNLDASASVILFQRPSAEGTQPSFILRCGSFRDINLESGLFHGLQGTITFSPQVCTALQTFEEDQIPPRFRLECTLAGGESVVFEFETPPDEIPPAGTP